MKVAIIERERALHHRRERVIIGASPCSSVWIEQEPPKFKVVRSNRTRGTVQHRQRGRTECILGGEQMRELLRALGTLIAMVV